VGKRVRLGGGTSFTTAVEGGGGSAQPRGGRKRRADEAFTGPADARPDGAGKRVRLGEPVTGERGGPPAGRVPSVPTQAAPDDLGSGFHDGVSTPQPPHAVTAPGLDYETAGPQARLELWREVDDRLNKHAITQTRGERSVDELTSAYTTASGIAGAAGLVDLVTGTDEVSKRLLDLQEWRVRAVADVFRRGGAEGRAHAEAYAKDLASRAGVKPKTLPRGAGDKSGGVDQTQTLGEGSGSNVLSSSHTEVGGLRLS